MKDAIISGALLGVVLGAVSWFGNTEFHDAHRVSVFPNILVLVAFPIFLYPLLKRGQSSSPRKLAQLVAPGVVASAVASAVLTVAMAPIALRLRSLGAGEVLLVLFLTFCTSVLLGSATAAAIGLVLFRRPANSATGTDRAGA